MPEPIIQWLGNILVILPIALIGAVIYSRVTGRKVKWW